MPMMPLIVPQSVELYLTKWLEVASKGNVEFRYTSGAVDDLFLVFKCMWCGDNLHCKADQFKEATVPADIKPWVEKHRHDAKNIPTLVVPKPPKPGAVIEFSPVTAPPLPQYHDYVSVNKPVLSSASPEPPLALPVTGRKFRREAK